MLRSLPLAIAAAATSGAPAGAQDEAAASAGEVIVVTATKRETTLQDAPVSVSVFGEAYLEQNNIQEFSGFADSVPNVSAPDGLNGAGSAITIRGVTSQSRQLATAEPAAGAYLDGVYVGPRGFLDYTVFDLERIEVLRGPQGTLWGRNTAAGAVIYTSRAPTEHFEGYARAEVGNYNLRALRGAVSGPIVEDALLFRLAGVHYERDGYTDNLAGGTLGTEDQQAVRGQLEWRPGPDVSVRLIGQYLSSDSIDKAPTWYALPGQTAAPELSIGNVYGSRTAQTNVTPRENAELYSATALVDWSVGGFEFASVTGWQSTDSYGVTDDEGSAFDLAEFHFGSEGDPDNIERFSQELRVTTPLLMDRVDVTAGLYYFREDQDAESYIRVGEYVVDTFGLALPFGARALRERDRVAASTESVAFFGEANVYLSDALTLIAGWRVTDETKEFAFSTGAQFLDGDDAILLDIPFGPFTDLDTFEDTVFTGKLGLEYDVNDDVMVYATVSEGYKSGGFNRSFPQAPDALDAFFDPESVTNYEVGLRATLAGGRGSLNVTGFYLDYTDLQVDTQIITSGGQLLNQTANAAEAESYGVELEAAWRPADRLELNAALGLLHAEFTDFDPSATADYSGNALPFAPDFNASLRGRYELYSGPAGRIAVQGEWVHQTSYFAGPENAPEGEQDAASLLHARLAYTDPDERFELGLWGRNLTDEELIVDFNAQTLVNPLFAGATLYGFNAPRTWGVDLKVSF
ncbi:TonB-dependent receptor [Marinicauda salina]|nr:TonB-dependent receptor [Marinicauda salina]